MSLHFLLSMPSNFLTLFSEILPIRSRKKKKTYERRFHRVETNHPNSRKIFRSNESLPKLSKLGQPSTTSVQVCCLLYSAGKNIDIFLSSWKGWIFLSETNDSFAEPRTNFAIDDASMNAQTGFANFPSSQFSFSTKFSPTKRAYLTRANRSTYHRVSFADKICCNRASFLLLISFTNFILVVFFLNENFLHRSK